MIFNIPNNLSLLRIALIPCLILVFYLSDNTLSAYQKNLTATLIFLFAAITDWLDGYLARRLNQTSDFGAFIDPVADKLIIIAALIGEVILNPEKKVSWFKATPKNPHIANTLKSFVSIFSCLKKSETNQNRLNAPIARKKIKPNGLINTGITSLAKV